MDGTRGRKCSGMENENWDSGTTRKPTGAKRIEESKKHGGREEGMG